MKHDWRETDYDAFHDSTYVCERCGAFASYVTKEREDCKQHPRETLKEHHAQDS